MTANTVIQMLWPVAFPKKEISATEFMKIHSAYVTLSDPDKRAYYDCQYSRQPSVTVTSSNTASF
uniref:Chaperone protein dnaJ 11, chloroplastic-like n=1 Tax=Nicotiana sylvestris TaxID=4096 RepID=A0A1U7WEA3_NICSY